jgi:uncharacterized protein YjbJ (UPF0337 family)
LSSIILVSALAVALLGAWAGGAAADEGLDVGSTVTEADDAVSQAAGDAADAVGDATDGAQEAVDNATGSAQEAVDSATGSAQEAVDSATGNTRDAVENAAQGAQDVVNDAAGNANDVVASATRSVAGSVAPAGSHASGDRAGNPSNEGSSVAAQPSDASEPASSGWARSVWFSQRVLGDDVEEIAGGGDEVVGSGDDAGGIDANPCLGSTQPICLAFLYGFGDFSEWGTSVLATLAGTGVALLGLVVISGLLAAAGAFALSLSRRRRLAVLRAQTS